MTRFFDTMSCRFVLLVGWLKPLVFPFESIDFRPNPFQVLVEFGVVAAHCISLLSFKWKCYGILCLPLFEILPLSDELNLCRSEFPVSYFLGSFELLQPEQPFEDLQPFRSGFRAYLFHLVRSYERGIQEPDVD